MKSEDMISDDLPNLEDLNANFMKKCIAIRLAAN